MVHGAHTTYRTPEPPEVEIPKLAIALYISRLRCPPATHLPTTSAPIAPTGWIRANDLERQGQQHHPATPTVEKNPTDNMEGTMAFLLVTFAFLLSRFLDSCYSIYTTPSFVKLGSQLQ